MNLILSGMMGSGKTTVGIKIAERTGRSWVDTDGLIEARHGKISDIFEKYGEAHFRALERNAVQELSEKDGLIISTGGGLVLRAENVDMLKQNGKIVFLRAGLETLSKRLSADGTRPLLQSKTESVNARIAKLLAERTPVYEQTADYVVDVDKKTADELANEIINLIQNG
ncbi:MAG: shikimate kinase [Clostridia bacterium]|nr:shikimate kinase [Clostridia bacterium]